MAKDDWWIKFEIHDWLNDPSLKKMKRENRDSWLTACCYMRLDGSDRISGTQQDLSNLLGLTFTEFWDFYNDLERSKTADVTNCHEIVTIISRRYSRELSIKEYNNLRKQKSRSHANVTVKSKHIVKSKKLKDKNKEKEGEEKPSINPPFPIPRPDTNPDLWNEWLSMRRTIKKPFTQRGYDLLLKDLKALIAFDINERLAMAIDRKWQGLIFKEDKEGNGTIQKPNIGNGYKSEREKSAERGQNTIAFIDELRRQGLAEQEQALSGGNGGSSTENIVTIESTKPN